MNTNNIHHHIEPIFWGTSNLLQWNSAVLVDEIRRIYKNKDEKENSRFCIYMEKLLSLLPVTSIIPCGIYGYFPVITEHEKVVVLNPSDFHSEITAFKIKDINKSYFKSIRDEGDILAFCGITLGRQYETAIKKYCDSNSDKIMNRHSNEFTAALIDLLKEKISVEIRRGIGLTRSEGILCDVTNSIQWDSSVEFLFIALGLEERLDIYIGDNGVLQSNSAVFSVFFPRIEQNCNTK